MTQETPIREERDHGPHLTQGLVAEYRLLATDILEDLKKLKDIEPIHIAAITQVQIERAQSE